MNLSLANDKEFIQRLTDIELENLEDEHFGVKELAHAAGLDQSYLSKRLKKVTGKTVSRFISEVRLKRAMEMLREGDLTASEISYKVGFSSATYFYSCFHEYFGYPPGEVKKRIKQELEVSGTTPDEELNTQTSDDNSFQPLKKRTLRGTLTIASAIVLAAIFIWLGFRIFSGDKLKKKEKSIAVLPFINDSPDTTNIYFVNGIMEDIIDNLSKIKVLSVKSRTSAEQYRGVRNKSLKQVARELGANYVVEGSVRKYGDRVKLSIQLIEAGTDRHLLSQPYERKLEDVLSVITLQSEVALDIAGRIKAIVTPEETRLIEKIPIKNMEAYDAYLRGRFY